MRITITGGAGYVGSALVPYLLSKGHEVFVLDTFWYGHHLPEHKGLTKYIGDIRHSPDLRAAFRRAHAVIHLACVSNDPSFDMNPKLGKEINRDCFRNIIDMLWEQKVERFIYASSSSVYGVSDREKVTESTKCLPLTDYSRFKYECEGELHLRKAPKWYTIIRPATVAGFAPRMRFDLVLNAMTLSALTEKKITVNGHNQKRPNIHIMDMCRAYEWALGLDDINKENCQTFNVGDENLSLHQIADLVKVALDDTCIEIVEKENLDPRSYHIDSSKIIQAGFEYKYNLKKAILSIKENLHRLKHPAQSSEYYNIKKMKELGL